ncbi:MAG: SMP-30/gluconolactonase/LRE family protein [Candidatus Latescibacterota bacterium]|nr:SMP-30/gluconolactonase/LRE family protein [Candidatus Latescibacterota bacterium]
MAVRDIPSNRINKITPDGTLDTYREPSGNSNGLTINRAGRLLACEHGNRRVSISAIGSAEETLADTYDGKRLNSPNDVVVHSSGAVYFTDPPYGIEPEEMEQAHAGVYRVDPGGEIELLVDDFEKPNGLAFSPDESVLYIDDSHHQHIRAFDVAADGSLQNGRPFADLAHDSDGVPDGMKVDLEGNVYATNSLGIWVHSARGEFLGLISVPEVPANCAWGEDGQVLFITARTSVYRIRMRVPGVAVLGPSFGIQ